jgi:hypothetical protein
MVLEILLYFQDYDLLNRANPAVKFFMDSRVFIGQQIVGEGLESV